jgi:hypothetical protein
MEEKRKLTRPTLVRSSSLAVLSSLLLTALASAQVTATPATVALAATKAESVSITLTTPGPVTFNLNGGTTPGSVAPAWTTNWNLQPTSTPLDVCVYLSGDLTGSISGNTDTVPPANIFGSADGTGTYTALTGAACGQSNALLINSIAISGSNHKNGSQNDSVALEINETSPAISLSADTYSGTLNIIATAP